MATLPALSSKNSNSLAAGSTFFSQIGNCGFGGFTTESDAARTLRTGASWSKLHALVISNDRASSTVRSRVNGANGTQVITITGAGEFEDSTHSDTVVAGDILTASLVVGAGGTTFVITCVGWLFDGTTQNLMLYQTGGTSSTTVNGVTRFYSINAAGPGGDTTINQNEAQTQHSMRTGGTFKSLGINVRTNTRGGTSNFRFRVNGANSSVVIAVGAGVTGVLEDSTHSAAVVSGDEVNYSLDYFADGNNLRTFSMWCEFIPTSTAGPLIAANDINPFIVLVGTTTYYAPSYFASAGIATEADVRAEVLRAGKLAFLQVYLIANTSSGTNTIRVRQNGANATQVITFTSATGVLEDSTHTDNFAATDEVNFQVVTGAGGTSITFNNLAVLFGLQGWGPLLGQRRNRLAA